MTGKRLPTLILPRFLLTRHVGPIIRDLFLLRPRKWQTTPILVKISVFVRMGFSVWGSRFEMGIRLCSFCGFRRGILGLSSTRDCWCPYSTIGVRETGENRLLFSAVLPRAYKRQSRQRSYTILSKLLSSLYSTC